jgi:hypothetical protein
MNSGYSLSNLFFPVHPPAEFFGSVLMNIFDLIFITVLVSHASPTSAMLSALSPSPNPAAWLGRALYVALVRKNRGRLPQMRKQALYIFTVQSTHRGNYIVAPRCLELNSVGVTPYHQYGTRLPDFRLIPVQVPT